MDNKKKLITQKNYFETSLQRFLLAYGTINHNQCNLISPIFPQKSLNTPIPFYCLSLPQTRKRRIEFLTHNQYTIELCDGVKHLIGWLGCGISFQHIIQKAKDNNCSSVIVCEDDCVFDIDFANRIKIILKYLNNHPQKWDIFSGMIVDVEHDTQILNIEKFFFNAT